jgi:hypothetical protein
MKLNQLIRESLTYDQLINSPAFKELKSKHGFEIDFDSFTKSPKRNEIKLAQGKFVNSKNMYFMSFFIKIKGDKANIEFRRSSKKIEYFKSPDLKDDIEKNQDNFLEQIFEYCKLVVESQLKKEEEARMKHALENRTFIPTDYYDSFEFLYLPEDRMDTLNIKNANVGSLKGLPQSVDELHIELAESIESISLEGLPWRCADSFYLGLYQSQQLLNFPAGDIKHLPKSCTFLDLTGLNVTSLIGINKVEFKRILRIKMSKTLEEGGLGLLLIPKLRELTFTTAHGKYKAFADIMNANFRKAEKDILDCKAELIENGLSAYAKL